MNALIGILGGDGIGPEVTAEGVRVLKAIEKKFGHTFTLEEGLIGGTSIDQVQNPFPDETRALCERADALLFGAVGGPKWEGGTKYGRAEQGLLEIRGGLQLYANLRPVVVTPSLYEASPLKADRLEGVDMLVVRELTGGIYFGEKFRDDTRAFDTCAYTVIEVERICRRACELAMKRRKKVTSVDKANALETSRLWRATVNRIVQKEFPEIELEHLLVDSCAMHLLSRPADFDVIVTENMFGDILTDEASMLTGSLGMLASASIGEGTRGLYEPIHGSAPDIAGKGIANPYGSILSVAMMMRLTFKHEEEAAAIERAVEETITRGVVTPDLATAKNSASSTIEVGTSVAQAI